MRALQFQQDLAQGWCGKPFPCQTSDEKEAGGWWGGHKFQVVNHPSCWPKPADRNKREANTEAELCNLTLPSSHLEELCFVSFSEIYLFIQHLPSLIGASPSCILIKQCWQRRISITSNVWHLLANSSRELLASGLAGWGLLLILLRLKLLSAMKHV